MITCGHLFYVLFIYSRIINRLNLTLFTVAGKFQDLNFSSSGFGNYQVLPMRNINIL